MQDFGRGEVEVREEEGGGEAGEKAGGQHGSDPGRDDGRGIAGERGGGTSFGGEVEGEEVQEGVEGYEENGGGWTDRGHGWGYSHVSRCLPGSRKDAYCDGEPFR